MQRWDFNAACCYDTEEKALATIPAGQEAQYELFAYRMFPTRFDTDGTHEIDLDREHGPYYLYQVLRRRSNQWSPMAFSSTGPNPSAKR